MTSKERVCEIMQNIQNKNPTASAECHWNELLCVIEELVKEKRDPDLLNAFFRLAIDASDIMEKKRPGWTDIMKKGIKTSMTILHLADQLEAAKREINDINKNNS